MCMYVYCVTKQQLSSMLLCEYCSGSPLTMFYIQLYTITLSLHVAQDVTSDVASVNSECCCVHLPYGEMLCDPVGCELV